MKIVVIVLWVMFGFYAALCIWIPEIRFILWKGTGTRLGVVTYSGLTLVFLSPLFFVLFDEPLSVYLIILFAGLMMVIGYLIDISRPK